MSSQTAARNISSKTKSADILTSDCTTLGEVILYSDGSAVVMDDCNDVEKWFDDPATGHKDALRYIFTSMCKEPFFTAKIFEAADIAEAYRSSHDVA